MKIDISMVNQRKKNIYAFLAIILSTVLIFRPVLNNSFISNANHIYNFEPWSHYNDANIDKGNFILSDLTDSYSSFNVNVSVFTLIDVFSVSSWIMKIPSPYAMTIDTIIIFIIGAFFTFLLLRLYGVNFYISLGIAIGYAFGANNISEFWYSAFSGPALLAPAVYYFIERLFRYNKWVDSLWLLLVVLNFISLPMVHVVFFYSYVIAIYIVLRYIIVDRFKTNVWIKYTVIGAMCGCIGWGYVSNTASHYLTETYFNYRNGYGLWQMPLESIYTYIIAHIFGNPLHESGKWLFRYCSTAVFVGSISFLLLFLSGFRAFVKKEFHTIFFIIAAVLLSFHMFNFPFESIEKFYYGISKVFELSPPPYQKGHLSFLISILAGLGIQFFIENRKYMWHMILSIVIIASSLIICSYYYAITHVAMSSYIRWYFPLSIILSITGIFSIIGLSRMNGIRERIFGIVFILVYLIEAVIQANGWIPYSKKGEYYPEIATIKYLRKNLPQYGRIMGLDRTAIPNIVTPGYGIDYAAGRDQQPKGYTILLRKADSNAYVSHPTQYLFPLSTDVAHPVWDLANVHYFIASKSVNTALFSKYGDKIKIHKLVDSTIIERIPHPKPYLFVKTAVLCKTPEDMDAIFNEEWNIQEMIVVEKDEDIIKQKDNNENESNSEKTTISNFIHKKNIFHFSVNTQDEGYILLSYPYSDRWKIYIDGKSVNDRPIRAYHFMLAMKIKEKGHHEITLKYNSFGNVNVLLLSLALFIFIFFILIILIRKEFIANNKIHGKK